MLLLQFAETLGLTEAALMEEKAADVKLSEVATFVINLETAHQEA